MTTITHEELRKAALHVSSARLDYGFYNGLHQLGKETVQTAGQDVDVKEQLVKTNQSLNSLLDKLIVLTLEYAEQQRLEENKKKGQQQ